MVLEWGTERDVVVAVRSRVVVTVRSWIVRAIVVVIATPFSARVVGVGSFDLSLFLDLIRFFYLICLFIMIIIFNKI